MSAFSLTDCWVPLKLLAHRFTSYDFKKMQRRSYYPHNQQLISTATATSSGLASSRPGTPGTELRVDSGIMINSASMDLHSGDDHMRERAISRVDNVILEKDYP